MRRVILVIALSGSVAVAQEPPPRVAPVAIRVEDQPIDPTALIQASSGSLLQAAYNSAGSPELRRGRLQGFSFYAVPEPEPKVIRKHDLVTVIVREESAFKHEGSTDLQKQAAIDAKIEEFLKFDLANFALSGAALANPPSLKASANRSFQGEASVDRTDSVTFRIQAEVIDVKPNGTLVLQARKRIQTDEEVQILVLTGTCRAEDITPDNTILSTQLHDQDLRKSHEGAVRDRTKRGGASRLLDAMDPF